MLGAITPEQTASSVQAAVSIFDPRLALTLGVPALIAVVGWIVGHWLNSMRELKNRRREARLKGLESAYKCLALSAVRDWTDDHKMEFERFVAEIQLYGSPHQVQLMTKIVDGLNRQEPSVSFDALLEDLRDSLRQELRMEPVRGPIWWYRFTLPQWEIERRAQQSDQAGTIPEPQRTTDKKPD